MTVRAVLLDAGETLITPVAPMSEQLRAALPPEVEAAVDEAEVRAAFEEAWTERSLDIVPGEERYRQVPGGALQYWREILQATFERVGHPLEAEEAEALYLKLCEPSSWRVFDDVEPTLRALSEAGVLLAVASNWDRGLPRILNGVGLGDWFRYLGVSEVIGHEKPASAFFHRVLSALDVPPSEAVHIGDRVFDDLEGARGAGIRGFVIDRRGAFTDADWVLRSLEELPRRIL